jgi:hypothetical protein
MKGKRIGADSLPWEHCSPNGKIASRDFLPEAQLSWWLLAGLLAHFSVERLPKTGAFQWHCVQRFGLFATNLKFTAAGTAPDSHRVPYYSST